MKQLFVLLILISLFSCHSKYEGLEKKTPFSLSFRNKSKRLVSVFIPKRYSIDELNTIAECVVVDKLDEETQSVYFYLNKKANKQAWARVYVRNGKAAQIKILGLTSEQIEPLKKIDLTKKGYLTVGKWINDSDKGLLALYSDSLKPSIMRLDYVFPDSVVSIPLTMRTDFYGQVHYQFDQFDSYIEMDKSGDMSMHFTTEPGTIYFNKLK